MPFKPLGLSPVDTNTLFVTFGAGKPIMYSETGYAVAATLGHRIKEKHFRPRFLSLCSRGLISFRDWKDMGYDIRARTVVAYPKAVEAIREIQIALGGEYDYYTYFDPYIDYEKTPEKMDRFLKGPMTIDAKSPRNIKKKELFKSQWEQHQKDPHKFRWF